MSKEKSKFRMSIPKSEEDYKHIEEEINKESEGGEDTEVYHDHELGLEVRTGEDVTVLLLNTIAHTLSHIEMELGNINTAIQEIGEKTQSLRSAIFTLVKALLYSSISKPEAKKKLLHDILEELMED
jgi:hypothetical protein